MSKWYGNINNRLEENRQFCEEIKVGTGVTEYLWSDRHAYEVVGVQDQKHILIRKYDAKSKASYSNEWELISNPDNPVIELAKRGKYWYSVQTATIDDVMSEDINIKWWLASNGFDPDYICKKGKQRRYHRMNISIGKADYYYDYEF